MANRYSSTFGISGVPTLTSITVNGTVYPVGAVLNPATSGLAAIVQAALNALGINCFFAVTEASDNLTLFTACTNQVLNAVTLSTGSQTAIVDSCEAGEDCTLHTPLAVFDGLLEIGCDNLSCLTFSDTTGDFSASNTGGYGTPNNPSRSEILSTTFNLWDSDGTTLLGSYTGAYIPSSDGRASICLSPQNFGFALTQGVAYVLEYQLNFQGAICTVLETDFTFPCCGDSVSSDLATNFTITELLGCSSFNLTDTTGTFDPQANPGGYGAPNPSYSDIQSTLITVVLSTGQIFTFDTFIPTAANPTFNITAQMLGVQTLPVGVYTITYQVFLAGMCQIGYSKKGQLFRCAADACFQARLATMFQDCCDEKTVNENLKLCFEYQSILKAAETNINCVVGDLEAWLQKCSQDCPTCP